MQDAIWSTAVQYGGGTVSKFRRGLAEAHGKDFDLAALSDADIVKSLQDSKLRHVDTDFASSDPDVRDGIRSRIKAEQHDLVAFAETGVPVQSSPTRHAMRIGSSGDSVSELQGELNKLGYLSSSGTSLTVDGSFGPATRDAVRSFQRSSGLSDDGVAGPSTLDAIRAQNASRDHSAEQGTVNMKPSGAPGLDHPSHPDNPFFEKTKDLVCELDRSHGREPDQRSANLASVLVVSARTSGLSRIDQVVLSDDSTRVWAVQRPPGIRDNFFNKDTSVPTVESLNTPVDRSTERWPAAMQSFENHQQAEAQVREQVRSQIQSQTQSQQNPVLQR